MASMNTIDAFIRQVSGEKTAADGGKPLSEPGSIGGETTHPVKKVDDRLEAPKTGDRSKENSKDVKDAVGEVSVEGKPDASVKAGSILQQFAKIAEGGAVSQPGSAVDDHQGVTLKIAPTGEDKAHETASAKAGKDDKKQGNMGGTTHPASTENDSLDGHKYAFSIDTPIAELYKIAAESGTAFLTGVHTTMQKQAEYQGQAPVQQAVVNTGMHAQLAHDFGAEMAGILTNTADKKAVDNMVLNEIASIIKLASFEADLFINYATDMYKQAGGLPEAGGPPPEDAMAPGGGMPPGGAEPGMPPGGDAMMGALGGAGGGEGGEGGEELLQVLDQMGIDPGELAAIIQSHGGLGGGEGGGGGGGPAGGGAPPEPGAGGEEPAPEPEPKTAAAKPVKGQPRQQKSANAVEYLTELLSRNRR